MKSVSLNIRKVFQNKIYGISYGQIETTITDMTRGLARNITWPSIAVSTGRTPCILPTDSGEKVKIDGELLRELHYAKG